MGSPLVDCDWHAFFQALYKGIEGGDWGEMYENAKALWKMKAANETAEEYNDPTREDNIRGRNETRLALWEEHLKDPIVVLDKALKWVENSYWRSRPR